MPVITLLVHLLRLSHLNTTTATVAAAVAATTSKLARTSPVQAPFSHSMELVLFFFLLGLHVWRPADEPNDQWINIMLPLSIG